jgi:hypothetical protein
MSSSVTLFKEMIGCKKIFIDESDDDESTKDPV